MGLELVEAIRIHDLHVCSDGAFRKTIGRGSHAWVFSTADQNVLWKGAGPALGHPDLMTSYRAELAGLTSVLFVLHWVCKHFLIEDGTVIIYCDNDAALNETFYPGLASNNPYTQLSADMDLISTARDLLSQLPITV